VLSRPTPQPASPHGAGAIGSIGSQRIGARPLGEAEEQGGREHWGHASKTDETSDPAGTVRRSVMAIDCGSRHPVRT